MASWFRVPTSLKASALDTDRRLVENSDNSPFLKLLKWISVLSFFAVVPPLFLEFGAFILDRISNTPNAAIVQFYGDMPLILLAYYGGVMGAILSYLYDRLNENIASPEIFHVMSRFLFGGIIGATSLFLINSAVLLRLFYPQVDVRQINPDALRDYRPIVAFAVFCGIIGPVMIKG